MSDGGGRKFGDTFVLDFDVTEANQKLSALDDRLDKLTGKAKTLSTSLGTSRDTGSGGADIAGVGALVPILSDISSTVNQINSRLAAQDQKSRTRDANSDHQTKDPDYQTRDPDHDLRRVLRESVGKGNNAPVGWNTEYKADYVNRKDGTRVLQFRPVEGRGFVKADEVMEHVARRAGVTPDQVRRLIERTTPFRTDDPNRTPEFSNRQQRMGGASSIDYGGGGGGPIPTSQMGMGGTFVPGSPRPTPPTPPVGFTDRAEYDRRQQQHKKDVADWEKAQKKAEGPRQVTDDRNMQRARIAQAAQAASILGRGSGGTSPRQFFRSMESAGFSRRDIFPLMSGMSFATTRGSPIKMVPTNQRDSRDPYEYIKYDRHGNRRLAIPAHGKTPGRGSASEADFRRVFKSMGLGHLAEMALSGTPTTLRQRQPGSGTGGGGTASASLERAANELTAAATKMNANSHIFANAIGQLTASSGVFSKAGTNLLLSSGEMKASAKDLKTFGGRFKSAIKTFEKAIKKLHMQGGRGRGGGGGGGGGRGRGGPPPPQPPPTPPPNVGELIKDAKNRIAAARLQLGRGDITPGGYNSLISGPLSILNRATAMPGLSTAQRLSIEQAKTDSQRGIRQGDSRPDFSGRAASIDRVMGRLNETRARIAQAGGVMNPADRKKMRSLSNTLDTLARDPSVLSRNDENRINRERAKIARDMDRQTSSRNASDINRAVDQASRARGRLEDRDDSFSRSDYEKTLRASERRLARLNAIAQNPNGRQFSEQERSRIQREQERVRSQIQDQIPRDRIRSIQDRLASEISTMNRNIRSGTQNVPATRARLERLRDDLVREKDRPDISDRQRRDVTRSLDQTSRALERLGASSKRASVDLLSTVSGIRRGFGTMIEIAGSLFAASYLFSVAQGAVRGSLGQAAKIEEFQALLANSLVSEDPDAPGSIGINFTQAGAMANTLVNMRRFTPYEYVTPQGEPGRFNLTATELGLSRRDLAERYRGLAPIIRTTATSPEQFRSNLEASSILSNLLLARSPEQGQAGVNVAISELFAGGPTRFLSLNRRFELARSQMLEIEKEMGGEGVANPAEVITKVLENMGIGLGYLESRAKSTPGRIAQTSALFQNIRADLFMDTLNQTTIGLGKLNDRLETVIDSPVYDEITNRIDEASAAFMEGALNFLSRLIPKTEGFSNTGSLSKLMSERLVFDEIAGGGPLTTEQVGREFSDALKPILDAQLQLIGITENQLPFSIDLDPEMPGFLPEWMQTLGNVATPPFPKQESPVSFAAGVGGTLLAAGLLQKAGPMLSEIWLESRTSTGIAAKILNPLGVITKAVTKFLPLLGVISAALAIGGAASALTSAGKRRARILEALPADASIYQEIADRENQRYGLTPGMTQSNTTSNRAIFNHPIQRSYRTAEDIAARYEGFGGLLRVAVGGRETGEVVEQARAAVAMDAVREATYLSYNPEVDTREEIIEIISENLSTYLSGVEDNDRNRQHRSIMEDMLRSPAQYFPELVDPDTFSSGGLAAMNPLIATSLGLQIGQAGAEDFTISDPDSGFETEVPIESVFDRSRPLGQQDISEEFGQALISQMAAKGLSDDQIYQILTQSQEELRGIRENTDPSLTDDYGPWSRLTATSVSGIFGSYEPSPELRNIIPPEQRPFQYFGPGYQQPGDQFLTPGASGSSVSSYTPMVNRPGASSMTTSGPAAEDSTSLGEAYDTLAGSMTDEQAWEFAMRQVAVAEGGLSMDRHDPGNWTGGEVGAGELKGTNFGISAASYPNLDIANLTQEEAQSIYKRDYWDAVGGDNLDPALALVAFDTAVNSGVGRANAMLGEGITDPSRWLDRREEDYRGYKNFDRYGRGWLNRVEHMRGAVDELQQPVTPMPGMEGDDGLLGGSPMDAPTVVGIGSSATDANYSSISSSMDSGPVNLSVSGNSFNIGAGATEEQTRNQLAALLTGPVLEQLMEQARRDGAFDRQLAASDEHNMRKGRGTT